MPLLVDAHELKRGLKMFRRTDLKHRNRYCRIKLPKEDQDPLPQDGDNVPRGLKIRLAFPASEQNPRHQKPMLSAAE